MKLLRYAFAEFTPKIPHMTRWSTDLGDGLTVAIHDLQGTEETAPDQPYAQGPTLLRPSLDESTVAVLVASFPTAFDIVNEIELDFDPDARRRAEDGLRYLGASLAIQAQVPCRLWSPNPYLALAGESEAERDLLERTLRIRLPKWQPFYPLAGPGLAWPQDFETALQDRREGVLLLGAAINANHGVGKLHELFRLFEHAFASAGAALVEPLFKFLVNHSWDLEYSEDEVRGWVENRNRATHADLKWQSTFAADHDVQEDMVRVEQAAYDVLFNKRNWHKPDSAREERNSLRCAVTATGRMIHAAGARMNVLSGWDQYNATRRYDAPSAATSGPSRSADHGVSGPVRGW